MRCDPTAIEALRGVIAELGEIQSAIVALSSRADDRWRHDLIALRRRLEQQIAGITPLLDAVDFAADDLRQARAALGRMRSSVAMHQANWPAVAIARDDPGYLASVRDVRAANRDFITLITRLLAREQPVQRS